MHLSAKNIHNICASLGTGKVSNLPLIKDLSANNLDGIYEKLSENVTPGLIKEQGSDILYKKAHSFTDTLTYPFTKMPKEILNTVAEKFNIESLYNSKMLTEFRQKNEQEQIDRAMRGLLQNTEAFIKKGDDPVDEFYKLLDENLAPDKAKYNTTHERTIARTVSGVLPAVVLGNDFYNKSIKNGKTEEEATEEAKGKRKQEIIATLEEAVSQYFMLGAFSGFVNNSTFGAPIINTLLGLAFHITSRLSTGRPLTRIKAPENILSQRNILSFEGFMEAAKTGNPVQFKGNEPQPKKEDKKHILTFKNIALACLASIGIGFGVRYANKIPGFDKLKETILNIKPIKSASNKFNSISDSFKRATTNELWMSKKEKEAFFNITERAGFVDIKKYFNKKSDAAFDASKLAMNNKNEILIGEYEKFIKIPLTNIKISKKELLLTPLAPFRIVKEIVSYPYKLVSAALEGLGVIEKRKPKKLKNDYNLVNTILDFKKQAAKFDNNIESKEFKEYYKKHFEKNVYSALNKETKSNVNNCNIGKLTSLLGVFSSIYFATTDDYNSTLKQTGDVEKANKDARLRGINKIIRTSVQNVIMNLNNLFKIPYSQSLLGAAGITAGVTLITDTVSRILSGMPARKMNREELEKYNKDKKEGALKGYYNLLDKITD